MSQTLDGVSSTPIQHGAKTLGLPLQHEGDFFSTEVRRTMIAAPASAYAPIRGQQTGYVLLLKYSDDLSQAAWTKAATTGTAAAATSPEGTATASKLAEDNTNAAHNVTQTLVVASGNLRAVVLLKAAERSFARLRFNNGTDGDIGATVFNLSTGAVVSGTGQIKALLNGWFACFITATATVTDSAFFIDLSSDGTTFSYAGSTGSGIYVWRATAYLSSAYGPAVQTTSATRACTSGPVDEDDPTAFLVDEREPEASLLELGVARWGRSYANVPAQLEVPTSFLFTAPNHPLVEAMSYTTSPANWQPPAGSYWFYGAYLVISVSWVFNSTAGVGFNFAGVIGYYGAEWTITGYTGSPATVLNITGHPFEDGDTLLYYRSGAGWYSFVVSSHAANSVTGTSTLVQSTAFTTYSAYIFLALAMPTADRVRRRNKASPDSGQVLNLHATRYETYALPGITLGVNSSADIATPDPYSVENYLAALDQGSEFDVTAEPVDYWKAPILVSKVTRANLSDV